MTHGVGTGITPTRESRRQGTFSRVYIHHIPHGGGMALFPTAPRVTTASLETVCGGSDAEQEHPEQGSKLLPGCACDLWVTQLPASLLRTSAVAMAPGTEYLRK